MIDLCIMCCTMQAKISTRGVEVGGGRHLPSSPCSQPILWKAQYKNSNNNIPISLWLTFRFFKVAREYAPTIPSFLKEAEELFNKSYCNHLLPSFFPQYDVPQFWFSRRKLDFSNKKLYCRTEKNKWQIKSRASANGYFALSSGAEGPAGRFFSLSSAPLWLACEQKTHFRSSLLSLRNKRRPEMRLLFTGYPLTQRGRPAE